jgi:hypothetical protein
MEKQLENLGKKEKGKQPSQPSSAQPGRAPARQRCLTGGIHLSTTTSSPAPSLSRSQPSGARLSAPVSSPARPFSLCAVGLPCQFRPPRARRGPASTHSRTSPGSSATSLCQRPSSFLSPARARTHSPASFHAVPPSLALCPRRQTSSETCARLLGHLARRRSRQATPSSTPR